MGSNDRAFNISDVLDLSKKSTQDNIDLTADIKAALSDYINDKSIINDKRALESIINKIDTDLQIEESIVMVLRAMKCSQSKSFSVQNKSILPSKTPQDLMLDNKTAKNFHLSSELSRKLLDHQYITRKKIIQTQLEKALCDIPLKRQHSQINNEFVPATTNQEFITLVGFNEVIDLLRVEQQLSTPDLIDNNRFETVSICAECGTDASPSWKKRKIVTASNDNGNEHLSTQSVCLQCSSRLAQLDHRREFENQIHSVRSQFEEQEKNLVRDYHDMLSSPKKLEMFRQEQEKRQRIQRMGTVTVTPVNRPCRASSAVNSKLFSTSVLGNISGPIQSDVAGSTTTGPNNCPNTKMILRTGNQGKETAGSPSNTVTDGDPVPYLQFMKALSLQATNCQQHLDREQAQQLEQIITMLQTNPGLVTNNNNNSNTNGVMNNSPSVLQLLGKLSNWQDKITTANSGNGSANANLMNLLSFFANWMQSQLSQATF